MPTKKRESKLSRLIQKSCNQIHFTRIESSTINGIPDLNGGKKAPEGGWDIDGDGNNILDSQQSDIKLKPEPFKSSNSEAVAYGFGYTNESIQLVLIEFVFVAVYQLPIGSLALS